MSLNINELKLQILQKNLVLESALCMAGPDSEEVKSIKTELDMLIYQYYKMFLK
jgi:hypothetical protein